MRRIWIATFALGAATFAVSAALAQSHSELQERYCTGDAFRLCFSEIPDENRIIACMARQRQALSPECRAVFDDPVPVARVVPRTKSRKPAQLPPE